MIGLFIVKIIKISSEIQSFRAVEFNQDFSIILGVAKSKGEGKSHNLGKTTLIELIDHILFGSRDSERIKAIKANFDNPIFYIDIESKGVISRVTADYSKKKKAIYPKEIRQAYEYFIRFQDDYKDEFRKVSIRGKDSTWKPLLMRLMGFNEGPLLEKYEVESTIADYDKFISIAANSGIRRESKQQDIERLEQRRSEILLSINTLDFSSVEDKTSIELASHTDVSIATLKRSIYIHRKELASINESLTQNSFVDLSSSRIGDMYRQMEIYFGDQLVKDLADVQAFFLQVTENRTTALNGIKKRISEKLSEMERELSQLVKKRASYLKIIISKDAIDTYRDLSTQLAEVETELSLLKQDIYKESIQNATIENNRLKTKQLQLAAEVATEIDENDEIFSLIKKEYSKIMSEVMDIDAELNIEKNSTGNIEFRTTSWKDGSPSQELKGEMAKKISCAAFDVALRIVNNDDNGFIIHDGVIDNADKNIKSKFINAMKFRAKHYNFQYILTAISDDLPESIEKNDIVITLSDRSESELLMGKSF